MWAGPQTGELPVSCCQKPDSDVTQLPSPGVEPGSARKYHQPSGSALALVATAPLAAGSVFTHYFSFCRYIAHGRHDFHASKVCDSYLIYYVQKVWKSFLFNNCVFTTHKNTYFFRHLVFPKPPF